jgi:iron complex outermembrane recepter protein
VRGFTLDNKFNMRRDGLPINAETAIALENKERVEVLKGISGIQSGTSAPGGLVNYVVKRPANEAVSQLNVTAGSAGNVGLAVDISRRFGRNTTQGLDSKEFGARINVAYDKLNTPTDNTAGSHSLAALALDWRVNSDSVVSLETESSRTSQPSVPALSLLGGGASATFPTADATININNQPWSLPVVFKGNTTSLRFEQAVGTPEQGNWHWNAQLMSQRLTSDDRAAFPFGCYDAVADQYYSNTYCPNGDYDLYDFRSENESRKTLAAQVGVAGTVTTGTVKHALTANLLRSTYEERGNKGAYNAVGTVNLYAPTGVAADPSLTYAYTNRDTQTTELSVSDAIEWNKQWSTWLGLRHSRFNTGSTRKTSEVNNSETFTTPWAAVSYAIMPTLTAYVSYGEGSEANVVPNKSDYGSARGQYLSTVRSKQTELGFKLKDTDNKIVWNAALFNINRPNVFDDGTIHVIDGNVRHTGFEFAAQTTVGAWDLGGSLASTRARTTDVVNNPDLNNQAPTNVPKMVLRANANYRFADIAGLSAHANLSYEGSRTVSPASASTGELAITLPAWKRVDAGVSYQTKLLGKAAVWSLDVNNLLDGKFFKESPTLYGHIYLVPQQTRTARLSVNVAF